MFRGQFVNFSVMISLVRLSKQWPGFLNNWSQGGDFSLETSVLCKLNPLLNWLSDFPWYCEHRIANIYREYITLSKWNFGFLVNLTQSMLNWLTCFFYEICFILHLFATKVHRSLAILLALLICGCGIICQQFFVVLNCSVSNYFI